MSARFATASNSASKKGKKLTIKAFKEKPKLPENYDLESWASLSAAVTAILTKQASEASFEQLCQLVENRCSHGMQESTLLKLSDQVDGHIQQVVRGLVGRTPDPVQYLEVAVEMWNDFCSQMTRVRDVFVYLDRALAKGAGGSSASSMHKTIWEMVLSLLRKHILNHPEVLRKIERGCMDALGQDRRGDSANTGAVRNMVRMLTSIKLYAEGFEPLLFESTDRFYEEESSGMMAGTDLPGYLQHCTKRLAQEEKRVDDYLDSCSKFKVIDIAQHRLVGQHTKSIIDRVGSMLLSASRFSDLNCLLSLYKRVQAVPLVKQCFLSYIKSSGLEIVQDSDRAKEMVPRLLLLSSQLEDLVSKGFLGDKDFADVLKEGLETVINSKQNTPAELIAKHMDGILRTGGKGKSETELEEDIDKSMVLFKYINGKDVFEAFYKKELGKRLLLGRSSSIDLERVAITKLKHECGHAFTSKLEGMFKDIDMSRELMQAYQESLVKAQTSGMDLHVFVLTTGFWPNYTSNNDIKMPAKMAAAMDSFKAFYNAKHSGRKLTWVQSHSTCILKARFKSKRMHELSVSLFQAIVLMLFNDRNSIPFKDILHMTGIPDPELRLTLQSLACGKPPTRVLSKFPKGKDVDDDDVFHFNADFTSKTVRIRINTIQARETVEEHKETEERVFADRQFAVDAAIVRIMKARKELSHNQLIDELIRQLKFPVKVSDIKKRIETLIEREYLERDDDDQKLYKYMA